MNRTCFVAFVLLCVASSARDLTAQSLGFFQNTADGRTYEVRRRGETGLDIYDADGTIAATLNKKRPADRTFKGQTQRMATQCPNSAGRIEVLSVSPERIQAHVELPSIIDFKPTCDIYVFTRWQSFDLIRQNAATTPPPATSETAPAPAAAPVPATNVIERAGIHFEVEHCDREGTRIVCHLAATNTLGDDVKFFAPTMNGWAHRVYAVDSSGNRLLPAVSEVGNTSTDSQDCVLIPGLRSPVRLVFENTRREVDRFARISIPLLQPGNQWVEFNFSDIPVQETDRPAYPTSASSPASGQTLARNGVSYTLRSCRRESSDLQCSIDIQNAPADQHIQWNVWQTYAIDQAGNRAKGVELLIDGAAPQFNQTLPANAKVRMDIKLTGLASNATNLVRLEVKGNDGADLSLRFTDIPLQK